MSRAICRGVTVAVLVAGLAACGDRAAVFSPPRQTGGSALRSTTAYRLPLLRRLTPLSRDYATSATIGVLGGIMVIPQAGLTVVIPPGAVTTPTKITITAFDGSLVDYSFAPHGLRFGLPISVVQLISMTNAAGNLSLLSSLTGGYLPNDLGDVSSSGIGSFSELFKVRIVPPGIAVGPAALFTTNHFSGYAYATGKADGCASTDEDCVSGDVVMQ